MTFQYVCSYFYHITITDSCVYWCITTTVTVAIASTSLVLYGVLGLQDELLPPPPPPLIPVDYHCWLHHWAAASTSISDGSCLRLHQICHGSSTGEFSCLELNLSPIFHVGFLFSTFRLKCNTCRGSTIWVYTIAAF